MNIQTFFSELLISNVLQQNSVIQFYGTGQYPLLFFSQTMQTVANCFRITQLDVSTITFTEFASKLSTSFLGFRSIYWIHNLDVCDARRKKKIVPYLQAYQGPNTILFFSSDKKILSKNGLKVMVPELVEKKEAVPLLKACGYQLPKSTSIISSVFLTHKKLTLDQLCLLAQYVLLVGNNSQEFTTQWLYKIIAPEHSLFTLSQYFFAKNAQQFFKQWARISKEYTPVFWTIFWSEQLWRAYHYVQLSRVGNYQDAKKMGFRLPFSFLRNDWRKTSVLQLKEAHQQIYQIDCKLKHGGHAGALDLFYSKFLSL